jgi:hypothetical protein
VYVLIISNNHFEGGNNILMFMHIVCQCFSNLIDNFILYRIET